MNLRCLSRCKKLITARNFFIVPPLRNTRQKSHTTKTHLEGIVVAPLTPFDKTGEVDLTNIGRCGKYFKQSKFNGLFVNGTFGEGLIMANSERKKVAEKWKEVADENGLFTILHVGTGNYKDTQDLARHAQDIGVDAIAVLPTTYHKPPTEEQLVCYLEKIAEAVPELPLMFYDYNITTGVYLNIPRMLTIAESRVPTLCGMKHSSPELTSALNCATVCGGKYRVFFGAESLYLPTLSLGIPDVITTPVMGEYFYNIKQTFDAGDIQKAQEHQLRAMTLINVLQAHGGGIGGYKVLFKLLTGIDVGSPRLPLAPLSKDFENTLKHDLQKQGFQLEV